MDYIQVQYYVTVLTEPSLFHKQDNKTSLIRPLDIHFCASRLPYRDFEKVVLIGFRSFAGAPFVSALNRGVLTLNKPLNILRLGSQNLNCL